MLSLDATSEDDHSPTTPRPRSVLVVDADDDDKSWADFEISEDPLGHLSDDEHENLSPGSTRTLVGTPRSSITPLNICTTVDGSNSVARHRYSLASNAESIESFDNDFDIPDDDSVLAVKTSATCSALSINLWADSTELFQSPPLRPSHYHRRSFIRSSPTPSSNASAIASESEDETFEDLQLPEGVDVVNLYNRRKEREINLLHLRTNDDTSMDQDICDGLEIPDDQPINLKQPIRQSNVPLEILDKFYPSRLPRPIFKPPVFRHPELDDHSRAASIAKPAVEPLQQARQRPDKPGAPAKSHLTTNIASFPGAGRGSAGPNLIDRHRKIMKSNNYGDGTELDALDDLPVPNRDRFLPASAQPRPGSPSAGIPPSGSFRSSEPKKRSLMSPMRQRESDDKSSSARSKKRQKQKPTLIKKMNHKDTAKTMSGMVYNPVLHKWEGNEDILKDFDRIAPNGPKFGTQSRRSFSQNRPALISSLGSGSIPRVLGSMEFDPVKMCWKGNEEEKDVFADIDDDAKSISSCVDNGLGSKNEFTLSASEKEALYISESSHKLLIGKWYPKVVANGHRVAHSISRMHLYDIRELCSKERAKLR
ncbi:hypothetical protein BJ742DRAFT_756965 [Cladochytrium replicatum]|nr:hypothetical protein BJ742DRAFT_756965 [Cladochytrium replicatum]